MFKYGLCLNNFMLNPSHINNAILTMMYHVGGECRSPDTLLQENILNSFLEIMDNELVICQVNTYRVAYDIFIKTSFSLYWKAC